MSRKKICSQCGKMIDWNSDCTCKKIVVPVKKSKESRDMARAITSRRWARLRSLIIKRDGGFCQRCFVKYGSINSEQLQVHHIKPRIYYPELVYEVSNLITLCKTCNLQLGTQEELDFKSNIDLSNIDLDFKL